MMHPTKVFFIALVLMLATSAAGQLGPKNGAGLRPVDLDRVQVGSRAPDFTLASSNGTSHSLSDSIGKQNVVLVFYRGHW